MTTEPQNLSHEMILPAYKALHLSRNLYKSPLFMQNKPNFRKAEMNVSAVITKDYRKNDAFAVQKTNPIQTQFKAN
jgi:hypothetical protein